MFSWEIADRECKACDTMAKTIVWDSDPGLTRVTSVARNRAPWMFDVEPVTSCMNLSTGTMYVGFWVPPYVDQGTVPYLRASYLEDGTQVQVRNTTNMAMMLVLATDASGNCSWVTWWYLPSDVNKSTFRLAVSSDGSQLYCTFITGLTAIPLNGLTANWHPSIQPQTDTIAYPPDDLRGGLTDTQMFKIRSLPAPIKYVCVVDDTNINSPVPYGKGRYVVKATYADPGGLSRSPLQLFTATEDQLSEPISIEDLHDAKGVYVGQPHVFPNGPYTILSNTVLWDGTASYNGQWVQLELPSPVQLTAYILTAAALTDGSGGSPFFSAPEEHVLLGSNNGRQWAFVHASQNNTDSVWSVCEGVLVCKIDSTPDRYPAAYRYYRLVPGRANSRARTGLPFVLRGLRFTALNPAVTYRSNVYPPIPLLSPADSETAKLPDGYSQVRYIDAVKNGLKYGGGLYTASCDRNIGVAAQQHGPIRVLTGQQSETHFWKSIGPGDASRYSHGSIGTFLRSTYPTLTTRSNVQMHNGQWIQVELPDNIFPSKCIILPRKNLSNAPRTFALLASDVFGLSGEFVEWTCLHNQTTAWAYDASSRPKIELSLPSLRGFAAYRLVVTSVLNSSGYVAIDNLQLYTDTLLATQGITYPPSDVWATEGRDYKGPFSTHHVVSTPQGTYVLSGSRPFSEPTVRIKALFSRSIALYRTQPVYSASGLYFGNPPTQTVYTRVSGATELLYEHGEYVQIMLPTMITLDSFSYRISSTGLPLPKEIVLFSSDDGQTWDRLQVFEVDPSARDVNNRIVHVVDLNGTPSRWFRWVFTRAQTFTGAPAQAPVRIHIRGFILRTTGEQTFSVNTFADSASMVYPPAVMSRNAESILGTGFADGLYEAAASSNSSLVYRVFRTGASGEFWMSSNSYEARSGRYMGRSRTRVKGLTGITTIPGEWIQLSVPNPVGLETYRLDVLIATSADMYLAQVNAPLTWYLVAKTREDDEPWNMLYNSVTQMSTVRRHNIVWPASTGQTFACDLSGMPAGGYKLFRLVVSHIRPNTLLGRYLLPLTLARVAIIPRRYLEAKTAWLAALETGRGLFQWSTYASTFHMEEPYLQTVPYARQTLDGNVASTESLTDLALSMYVAGQVTLRQSPLPMSRRHQTSDIKGQFVHLGYTRYGTLTWMTTCAAGPTTQQGAQRPTLYCTRAIPMLLTTMCVKRTGMDTYVAMQPPWDPFASGASGQVRPTATVFLDPEGYSVILGCYTIEASLPGSQRGRVFATKVFSAAATMPPVLSCTVTGASLFQQKPSGLNVLLGLDISEQTCISVDSGLTVQEGTYLVRYTWALETSALGVDWLLLLQQPARADIFDVSTDQASRRAAVLVHFDGTADTDIRIDRYPEAHPDTVTTLPASTIVPPAPPGTDIYFLLIVDLTHGYSAAVHTLCMAPLAPVIAPVFLPALSQQHDGTTSIRTLVNTSNIVNTTDKAVVGEIAVRNASSNKEDYIQITGEQLCLSLDMMGMTRALTEPGPSAQAWPQLEVQQQNSLALSISVDMSLLMLPRDASCMVVPKFDGHVLTGFDLSGPLPFHPVTESVDIVGFSSCTAAGTRDLHLFLAAMKISGEDVAGITGWGLSPDKAYGAVYLDTHGIIYTPVDHAAQVVYVYYDAMAATWVAPSASWTPDPHILAAATGAGAAPSIIRSVQFSKDGTPQVEWRNSISHYEIRQAQGVMILDLDPSNFAQTLELHAWVFGDNVQLPPWLTFVSNPEGQGILRFESPMAPLHGGVYMPITNPILRYAQAIPVALNNVLTALAESAPWAHDLDACGLVVKVANPDPEKTREMQTQWAQTTNSALGMDNRTGPAAIMATVVAAPTPWLDVIQQSARGRDGWIIETRVMALSDLVWRAANAEDIEVGDLDVSGVPVLVTIRYREY